MAQQTLQTVIALSGRVDNSFGALGTALLNVGSHIDALSQKVIGFGKESVKEFASYDDAMREVQALGEYDDKTMKVLDEYNKTIAQTSRYTMEQAAEAEVMIAQLGLNMEQTKTLMPTVMNLATAANISLAESLDYLYFTLNGLGMPLEDVNLLADQMAKTAAISSADIDTLGQSMQRLGSGAQFFTGGSDEILAILAGISQFGKDMQGKEAGTQLRNFMLTLLAPTAGKEKLLKSLGVSEEEWVEFEAYMDEAEIDITNTQEAMNELGLTVYDSATGQVKPAIQILGELNAALSTMSDDKKNELLGNLFGKRTTITASNLLSVLDQIIQYQKLIQNGSAGYTEAMAEAMDGGLGGTLREFEAAYSAMKVKIGEAAAPDIGLFAKGLTNIVNAIANMDDENLSALVAGAEAIAIAGPAIMAVGAAFRLIGYAMTPAGGATMALTAFVAAAAAIHELSEADFESQFGQMDIDSEALTADLKNMREAFNATYAEVNKYNTALNDSVESYKTASATLSSELLTLAITGAEMTPEQAEQLKTLGDTMGKALLDGIDASFDESVAYLSMLSGGLEEAAANPIFQNRLLSMAEMKEGLVENAATLGKEIGEAIGKAADGHIITGDERNAIMEKIRAYDEAMAFVAGAENAAELELALHKARGTSWDSIENYLAENKAERDAQLEDAEAEYYREVGKAKYQHQYFRDNGITKPGTDVRYEESDEKKELAELERLYLEKQKRINDDFTLKAMTAFDALISDSEHGMAWSFLKDVWENETPTDPYGVWEFGDADLSQYLPEGVTGEEMNDALYNLWKSQSGFWGLGKKLSHILKSYPEEGEMVKEMLDSLLNIEVAPDAIGVKRAEVPAEIPVDTPAEIPAEIVPHMEEGAIEEAVGDATIDAEIAPEITNETAAIDVKLPDGYEDGRTYMSNLAYSLESEKPEVHLSRPDGYADGLNYAIGYQMALDANKPKLRVGGAMASSGRKMFAEGGRATEPSIFGEAGPEWAIPEEHTQRTAGLLDEARRASGFTWPELMSQSKEMHAQQMPTQIIYSPTIVANDASGVEQKLLEDKERFERWWKDKQLHDDVEVYV